MERKIEFKGTESRCMLVEYVTSYYYVMFQDPSYYILREKKLSNYL